MSSSEKNKTLEQQFRSETGGDMSELENLKISEAVGETVGENFSDGSANKKTATSATLFDPIHLIKSVKAQKIILPTIARQRAKVLHALEKEQQQLIKKAEKMQRSRKFSAAAIEEIYLDIRRIRSLIDELFRAAGKRITEMYRRYVLKSG
jgi:hypothetical protein